MLNDKCTGAVALVKAAAPYQNSNGIQSSLSYCTKADNSCAVSKPDDLPALFEVNKIVFRHIYFCSLR